jgi:hypothetical protein
MDPFNALSTTAATWKIPPLKETPPAKVMSCTLVALTDLDDLVVAKEVTGGASAPSAKMASRSAMVCGHSGPGEEGRPSLAHQGSPYTRGCGTCSARALSPRLTIKNEHRLVMPTRPTTEILTSRKVTIQCQLVVPSSSSDDNLSLEKQDARVDVNTGGVRVRYTQEPSFMSELPLLHCVRAAGWSRVWQGHTESASSNPTPWVQRRHPPPKIYGPLREMEFTDNDMEEEKKEKLSNEVLASLK